jgi:hypothetical protein
VQWLTSVVFTANDRQVLRWIGPRGWHSFRRGIASNLFEAPIVINYLISALKLILPAVRKPGIESLSYLGLSELWLMTFRAVVSARIPAMADLNSYLPAIDLVGTVASVVGLGFTIYVLIVTTNVKKQVEEAKALARRQVEEAKALARKRNLVEDLDDASQKLQQIGNFLQQRQWVGVQIRTGEVLVICREAMVRWSDHLSDERRNGISTAMTQIRTIATQLAEIGERQITSRQNKALADAHLKAAGHISAALGEARRKEERDGSNDAD